MTTPWSILTVFHLLGLALALGAGAVKLALLLECRAESDLTPVFLRVSRTVTRLIVVGMALATLSGVAWVLLGRPLTPALVVKLGLVAALWVVGPFIDKAVEPRFRRLALAAGPATSPELGRVRSRYLALEVAAVALLGAVTVLGVLA